MGKHTDALGKIEDYQAPWETAAGETEIDKDRLKRFLFGLASDKAKAQDARDEFETKATESQTEAKAAQKKLEDGTNPDLAKELETERAKTATEKTRADEAERQNLVRDIAADKGLTPAQAKRLQGSTKDELEKDADELVKTFGVEGRTDGDDGDEDGGDEPLRRTPRRGTNPGDPQGGPQKVTKEPDYEAVAASLRTRTF